MTNPLLAAWDGPYDLPHFPAIKTEHFRAAFDVAIAEAEAEFEAIANDQQPASFANTVEALERHGRLLRRVSAIFYNRAGADTGPELQAIEREMTPRLSQLHARKMANSRMFSRLDQLMMSGEALNAEQARVLELMHRMYVKGGARLDDAGKARMEAIMVRLSELGTAFSQNVLKDEAAWSMALGDEDLGGLPGFLIDAAKDEAKQQGKDGHVITLSRSSIEPFLTFSDRRDLRERAFLAWSHRGEGSNWPLVAEIIKLRAERARLLGFDDFASFKLHDQMASSPDRVHELLMTVWSPARARALEEQEALSEAAARDGINGPLAPWDWRYYAEKERKRLHDLNEAEIKPYLALDKMIEAAFDVAGRLFSLTFEPIDVPLPHPDARAWKVLRDGDLIGLFIGDYFARPSKRSGAWASSLRGQQKLWSPGTPVITNTCNFVKSDPALLSWTDARTLFHEFGHALHGLMSDVTYPFIAGTSVARDFVELPSQLYEHWLSIPEILAKHARHIETGEPMPKEMIDRILAAENFGQGFKTVEFTASALVDLEMHKVEHADSFDAKAFEAQLLSKIGMPEAITMRHRTPHFQHVFSGDGYSAGYYSYMWSEVMDADAFQAFREAGDPFDASTAKRLGDTIYSVGGSVKPETAYTDFRGRLPGVEALLEGRGLAG
jgi:peptidyl-dipeptidase Dcp